jgi:hypothetical protein
MKSALGAWFTLTLGLGFIGLLVGGVAGLAGALLAGTVERVASIAGGLYWLAVAALPLALLALVDVTLDDQENRPLFAQPARAYGIVGTAGLAGALAGSLAFFVPATNLPFIIKRLDTIAVRTALYSEVSWFAVLVVTAVTTLAAVAIGAWAYRRARGTAAR